MHFFVDKLLSITVMTYSYVYHPRNLRRANLLRTQQINFSMQLQHVRISFDVSFLENPTNTRTNFIFPKTRVPAGDLHHWQYVSIFISFYAIISKSHGLRQPNRRENRI